MSRRGLIKRAFWVLALTFGYAVFWFVGWLGLLLSMRGKKARQVWFAQRLAKLLTVLGATYVKIGQIMSTRPDIFAPHIITELTKLQDNVGQFPYEQVAKMFTEDFGASPETVFLSFDKTPIASASVAQVHFAVMNDGHEVAVKVRRPEIEKVVDFDLALLRAIARCAAIVPSVKLTAPVETVEEFGKAIRAQIDLSIEAKNNQTFQKNFAGDTDVMLPTLIPHLCSSRILTMDYVRGCKIVDADRAVHDPKRLAKIGFRILLKMVFEDGFMHADLHPGNLFVREDGKFVLLDVGLVAELTPEDRRTFASYFAAWAAGDGKTMAHMMSRLSPQTKDVKDYPAYEREVMSFVEKYYGKELGEIEATRVVFDMLGILRRHRVRINPTFTMCNIAIAVTEGLGKQLDPTLDLMAEGLPFFVRLKQENKL